MLGPGSVVGRYVIKRKLAEGGMAEIFLASAQGPEGFSKDVVIKVVKEFLTVDSQFVQMFIAEARLASRLNHANVVQIFDFGKHDDSHYLAMEYVRGASLWDLRRKAKDTGTIIAPTLAAQIISQVARGLQYAHTLTDGGRPLGVVHRDVTPHNVLLSYDGAVKLTDFGIAKATTTHTVPGMLKGKFAYMSPEQSRGEKVDARTDIFALGVVAWELLTGGRLFDGDTDLGMLRAVQESLIPPPARLNPHVAPELSDIVMKALARPLPERFQTAFEFEKALANWVLKNAQSVDDTDVGAFLRLLFKEEFERANAPEPAPTSTLQDDFGTGDTRVRRHSEPTMTATPAPQRGVMDDDDDAPARPTEEFIARAAVKTDAAPAMRRSMRKLAPLPVVPSIVGGVAPAVEPNVIVRPSAVLPTISESAASQSATTPELPAALPLVAPKSYVPMMVALGLLVALLAGGLFVVLREHRDEGAAAQLDAPPVGPTTPAEENPPALDATPTPTERPAAVAVAPQPVDDATAQKKEPAPPLDSPVKPAAAAAPKTEAKAPPTVVKKTGTLSLRAVPFATVTVQGRKYEVTGVKTMSLPVGTYEVTFSHPRKTDKQQATVKQNETTQLSFSAN